MNRWTAALAAFVVAAAALVAGAGAGTSGPPQGTQSDAAFAASYATSGVTNVSATTQKTSCYTPEVEYLAGAGFPGYADGGGTLCSGAVNTGEDIGPYAQQDVTNDPLLVKDHSESDIRVDPNNPNHLIGQSKWFVNGQGYNHLLGIYESWDGGKTWSVQGHVPGYEGWTDNTDPVGAFDPWSNYYALLLPYMFYYDKDGNHKYSNGANLPNPTLPGEAITVAVHPAALSQTARNWRANDHVFDSPQAVTHDVDKQWIAIDTNPSSPFYRRVYAMWVVYNSFNSDHPFVSWARANRDGSHTPWSTPVELASISGYPFDQYLLPHVDGDGTVWTTSTLANPKQGGTVADITITKSTDGGATWSDPLPVAANIRVPTYLNTTFREGIVNSFAVGKTKFAGSYPLYVTYEDQSTGMSHVYLIASYDGGHSWTSPVQVDDGDASDGTPGEALQPTVSVAPSGTVGVTFYDRRLPCPTSTSSEAAGSGIVFDPGTSSSPGTPWGRANYCIDTAIQFYRPNLTPIGHNVRLSAHSWDPQLSTAHVSCICSPAGFIGDYFGLDFGSTGYAYTTSVSTFDYAGENPKYHQQQIVARIATP
ncbi:MAG: sialidase family protein [Gaiellaceae bacterium]